ncbi:MAG: hypothetical protein OK474_04170 [Thaumarchaeota archaeon]|nr:hypothetical protein [Nitrososphaerota archaeon]
MVEKPSDTQRGIEITLGVLSIVVSLVVILNPNYGRESVASLLAFGLAATAVRMTLSGRIRSLQLGLRGLGIVGGLLAIAIAALIILTPGIGLQTLTFLLASGLALEGIARLAQALNRSYPRWLRLSAFTVGAITVVLSGIVVLDSKLASISVVALITLALVTNGIDGIVSGAMPSTRKQKTLIKLILFSLVYGFLNVNWIDLYATNAPAYHIWLILTYMAPFGVLLVFQGFKDWQLALSLGLLVSLVNDLGYYFAGDLFFGFHVQLLPWLAGQLGFDGGELLFNFQGGLFTIPVTSYLMGFVVYLRILVVAVILYQWWRRPSTGQERTSGLSPDTMSGDRWT